MFGVLIIFLTGSVMQLEYVIIQSIFFSSSGMILLLVKQGTSSPQSFTSAYTLATDLITSYLNMFLSAVLHGCHNGQSRDCVEDMRFAGIISHVRNTSI